MTMEPDDWELPGHTLAVQSPASWRSRSTGLRTLPKPRRPPAAETVAAFLGTEADRGTTMASSRSLVAGVRRLRGADRAVDAADHGAAPLQPRSAITVRPACARSGPRQGDA
jgi:hypothetical protein